MPTIEPIVVTSPKTQTVPPLQKSDIFSVVNQGIVDGDIVLPEGGTKLYHHAISFAQIELVVISDSGTPITSSTTTFNFVSSVCTAQRYYPLAFTNRGSFGFLYIDYADDNPLTLKFISLSNLTLDTVTEL